jgi:hypothetical protein
VNSDSEKNGLRRLPTSPREAKAFVKTFIGPIFHRSEFAGRRSSVDENLKLKDEMQGYLSHGLKSSASRVMYDDQSLSRGYRIINPVRDTTELMQFLTPEVRKIRSSQIQVYRGGLTKVNCNFTQNLTPKKKKKE